VIEIPIHFVGDLHGKIFNLVRIPVLIGLPLMNRFLFLGDCVDRVQYSVEVTALVSQFLEHVAMLRSNHKFAKVNAAYGFKVEVTEFYGAGATRIYDDMNSRFEHMPLTALCCPNIFCIHSGISPLMSSLCQVKSIH
jgi:protein phosphatase